MWTFRLGLTLSVVVVAVPGVAIAAQRMRPVHPERQKMSAADRRELVLADLNAVLTGPASPTTIATTPYVSSRNGLCRRDVIALDYAPENDAKAHSPVRPVGVHAFPSEYHFLGNENTGSRDGWQKACARLSGKELYW